MKGGRRGIEHEYIHHLGKKESLWKKIRRLMEKLKRDHFDLFSLHSLIAGRITGRRKPGWIKFYEADVKCMEELDTNSIDVVVSVSSIEHMDPGDIKDAVAEFTRVLKPGAAMVITTSGAYDFDWFYEPCKGWCFSEKSLKEMFEISNEYNSWLTDFETLMDDFRLSQNLQTRLASSYYVSGNNGMPWGIWNPKYLPVGIIKFIELNKYSG